MSKNVCFLPHMKTNPVRAEVICMRKKKKVLVHLAIVGNEEFQQLGPARSERSEEWMSLFSSFSLGLGAPLCTVQTPIVAMSLSSPLPGPVSPRFHTGPTLLIQILFIFFHLFWKPAENLMNQILEEE